MVDKIQKTKLSGRLCSIFLIAVALFIVCILPGVSAFVWDDTLQSCYNMNEVSGTTAYDSNALKDGLYQGGLPKNTTALNTNFIYAQNTSLSGNMTVNDSIDYTGNWSINYWMKYYEGNALYSVLISKNFNGTEGFYFTTVTGNAATSVIDLRGNWNGVSLTRKTSALNRNQWYMVTIVKRNNLPYLYINGNVTTDVGTFGGGGTPSNLSIGDVANSGFKGSIDELSLWNKALSDSELVELYNEGNGEVCADTRDAYCIFEYNGVNSTFVCSAEPVIISPTGTYDYKKTGGILQLNYSSNSVNYSKDITITSSATSANIYFINRTGEDLLQVISWNYKVFENNNTYNTTTYETSSETFTINVTANSSLTAIVLDYNGTNYALSNSGSGIWTRKLDVPINKLQNNTLKYKFTYAGSTINSDNFYQNVSEIIFTICNATYNNDFLNISFKDEANLGKLNASLPLSTFIYYLGDGTVTKTYSYVNSSLNYNYTFCASPTTRNFHILPYAQFKQGTDYPQRIWSPIVQLYNSTVTNVILYLLNAIDGIYVTFQVTNTGDQVLSDVDVTATRSISGTDVIVGTGTTGASGTVTFWLNPDFSHDFTFSKSGFTDYDTSFSPTQTSYTIIMGGGTTSTNSTIRGISYSVLPTDNYLDNDTTYTFGFNLTSSYYDITEYGFNLRLADGTIIAGGSTSTEGTQLTKNYDVNNQTVIYLDAYWLVSGEYVNFTRSWSIQNTAYEGWSIKTFFTDLNTYMDSGLFGLDDFGRYLIAFIIIFVSVGLMGYKFGVTSPLGILSMTFGIVFFFDVITGILPTIKGIPNLPTFIAGLMLILSILNEVRTR